MKYTDPDGNSPIVFWALLYHAAYSGVRYVASQLPFGGVCPDNDCSPTARYDAAVAYIQDAMVTNAQGIPAQAAKALNANGLGTVAQVEWFFLVHPYAAWDQKPELSAMLGTHQGGAKDDAFFPIPGNDTEELFYDVWSNMHFGYVSAAGGFDEETVRRGANVSVLAGRNDPYDVLSVHLGYLLWERTGGDPSKLTPEMIRAIILENWEEYKTRHGELEPAARPKTNGR